MSQVSERSGHRPWPVPRRPWVMTQTWHNLLFAHWPVDPSVLAPMLPPGLTLETYGGQAWLAVVPFTISGGTIRGLIPVPGGTSFPELNVRTYATVGGKPGVWFFSLDAGSALAVEGARRFFHLPYLRAKFHIRTAAEGWIDYECVRTDRRAPDAALRMRYRPTGAAYRSQEGSLEHWLTERYCLYAADRRGRIFRAEIDHEPWPLQPAEAEPEVNTMAAAGGVVLPDQAPLLHFARRLAVHIWMPVHVHP